MPTKSLTGTEAGYQGTTFENVLQDCVVCGMLAIDPDGKVIALTGEAERAIRLPVTQRHSLSLQSLPMPVQSVIREVQQSGQLIADRQVILHSHSGPVALSVSAMPVAGGRPNVSVVVVIKDVSPANRFEQNFRRLDRLASVGTLAASMAHEIKNALVAIKTFIGIESEANGDAELAALARREMDRVDSILSQMLQFSAPTPPEFAAIQLHPVLDHCLRLVQHKVGGRLISFNREFNAAVDACRGDDHQLEQAFVNLFFNAVDAIGSEGTLTVSTDLIAGESRLHENAGPFQMMRVKISDTGAGIAAEDLQHIFEPFYTTKPSGTGLGLAVTRGIIAEHKGVIHVESRPGKGTTFTVLLPAHSRSGSC